MANIGNTSYLKIIGASDVYVQNNVGCIMTLKDLRHILALWLNMIFRAKLDRVGYEIHFENGRWKLTRGSLLIARGRVCNMLYKTHVKLCKYVLNVVEDSPSSDLWHKRL